MRPLPGRGTQVTHNSDLDGATKAHAMLASTLSNVLCNASNFPPRVAVRILGQDMRPLIEHTTDAVLTSNWLAAHDREVAKRAWDEGFDAGEKDAWDVDVTNEKHVCTPNPYRSASEGDNQ